MLPPRRAEDGTIRTSDNSAARHMPAKPQARTARAAHPPDPASSTPYHPQRDNLRTARSPTRFTHSPVAICLD